MTAENRLDSQDYEKYIQVPIHRLPNGNFDKEKMTQAFNQELENKKIVHHYGKVTLYYCVDGYKSLDKEDIKSLIDNDLNIKGIECDYSDIEVTDTQEF